MDAERNRLAVRTVLVSYLAAVKKTHDGDREMLRRRALDLLDVVAARVEPDADPELGRLLDDARAKVGER